MAETGFEKTEDPTPRRLEEARRDGNVARSADLSAACVLLAAMLLLYAMGGRLAIGLRRVVAHALGAEPGANPTRADDVAQVLAFNGRIVMVAVGPLVLGLAVVALAATVGQVGFLVTARPLQPNFARMSPARGLRNLVDVRAGVRLVMSLAKVLLIAAVAALASAAQMPRVLALAELEPAPMVAAAAEIVFTVGVRLALLLLLLALLDYAFQRWQRQRDLRMTRQEVKEELRRMEGDPLVRQRRTRVARELAMQRIGHVVPRADVVVTNPTHFAVALRYDSATMRAPRVVAKGADLLAQRIRQLATLHGVPLVERRELARAIYAHVAIGQEVPPEYYGAVAEVLAYVYRLSGRRSA